MAWPVLGLGGLELIVGISVASRADAQAAELAAGLRSARAVTVTSEVARLATVNATFEILEKVEMGLIALALVFLLAKPAPQTLGAVGLGLLLQCAALLVFDTFAHHRAERYVQWLIALPPA